MLLGPEFRNRSDKASPSKSSIVRNMMSATPTKPKIRRSNGRPVTTTTTRLESWGLASFHAKRAVPAIQCEMDGRMTARRRIARTSVRIVRSHHATWTSETELRGNSKRNAICPPSLAIHLGDSSNCRCPAALMREYWSEARFCGDPSACQREKALE